MSATFQEWVHFFCFGVALIFFVAGLVDFNADKDRNALIELLIAICLLLIGNYKI